MADLPQGVRAKFTHYRTYEDGLGLFMSTTGPVARQREAGYRVDGPLPTGGLTVCDLVDADGNILETAQARCHEGDNFNRKIGRYISQGRALKRFNAS